VSCSYLPFLSMCHIWADTCDTSHVTAPSRKVLCYNQRKNSQGKAMAVRLKVREIAEQKGYNISTLSRKADVGLSTIRRLWHDPRRPVDLFVLERISKA